MIHHWRISRQNGSGFLGGSSAIGGAGAYIYHTMSEVSRKITSSNESHWESEVMKLLAEIWLMKVSENQISWDYWLKFDNDLINKTPAISADS